MENQNQVATQSKNQAIDKEYTFSVAGQDVKLSPAIVMKSLIRGGGNVSDQEVNLFIAMCKYNQLNPFLNEAYLVKYGTSPAMLVTSKEAFFKRAEENKHFQGVEYGVIVMRDGKVLEMEGSFYLKTDELLGAWAKVHREDRKYATIAKVRLEEFDKKQSSWSTMKGLMICKVAKVQALREAFPTQLGAMYTEEEIKTVDISHEEIKEPRKNFEITISQPEPVQISQPEKFEM